MNRFFSARFLVAATLAIAALGAATVAEARPDVYLSIGFQNGPAWVEPAPVYVQPRPVYVQPRPVYVQPAPVYVTSPFFASPREVYERPRRDGHDARYEWERQRAWRHAEWHRHSWREQFRGGERHHGWDDRMYHH
ncbi:MAG: PXPV repeat protein [Caldimonas sp.]